MIFFRYNGKLIRYLLFWKLKLCVLVMSYLIYVLLGAVYSIEYGRNIVDFDYNDIFIIE